MSTMGTRFQLAWRQYSPLPTSDQADNAQNNDGQAISRVISSKRYRWTAYLLVCSGLVFLMLQVGGRATTSTLPGPGPSSIPLPQATDAGPVDWSRFAYTQYVTNSAYLCNSVMFFESLHRLGSKADRVMMYPSNMLGGNQDSTDARLLLKARDEYNVKLVPISVQHRNGHDATWADSFTKLLAFNQTQYDRVLSIDSDSLLLQHMDELFLIPPVPVAMPRAYWLYPKNPTLSSQVVLAQPSKREFDRIMKKVDEAGPNDYDMEILNWLYNDSALILPHRPYDMLTAEFRFDDHSLYLGSDAEEWDPVAIYNEAKLAHFSDWPIPKPWKSMPFDLQEKMQPACSNTTKGTQDCTEREIWNGFYSQFREQRERVCKSGTSRRGHRQR